MQPPLPGVVRLVTRSIEAAGVGTPEQRRRRLVRLTRIYGAFAAGYVVIGAVALIWGDRHLAFTSLCGVSIFGLSFFQFRRQLRAIEKPA